MVEHEVTYKAVAGQTYSLYGTGSGTDRYYRIIKEVADVLLKHCPDEKRLLFQIQKAGNRRSFFRKRSGSEADSSFLSFIRKTVRDSLSVYTRGVKNHLKNLPLSRRFDRVLRTREEQYHLYMIEIELVNRMYKEIFKKRKYKFALLPHCLRDFRPDCHSVAGDIEEICKGCTRECFIHLGSLLLKKYDIHPYISVTMELEKLLKKLKAGHPDIGALGIACVPELVNGMRLCMQLDIPPIGIPLDANRCSRWMGHACESSYNLRELEELLK